jgi:glycosyltransferase involved in cell wall biosynthesis
MTMTKIKVIHVITRFDKGGAAENTFLTVTGLQSMGYEVILVRGLSYESNMGPAETKAVESCLEDADGKGIQILTIRELVRRIYPLGDLKTLYKLITIFSEEKPHIVHMHTSKAGILGRWAARLAGIHVIIHSPHGHVFWGYFNKWKTRAYIFLERLTATITDRIIMLTSREKKDHLRCHIAHENKFTVIHSGVDLSRFSDALVDPDDAKKKLGIPKGTFVVGTVGRLTHIKGHKYLIEAARKILLTRPEMTFIFLGDGELMNDLKAQAASLGIYDKVKFLGWREDVAEVMATFDLFVLPSLNEGMGKVLVEAMAMRKPIIASNVGGIPDLVKNEENGLLVPPEDAEAIARSISILHSHPLKRRAMGEKGKAIAVEYGADAMVQKIDRLYRELVGG